MTIKHIFIATLLIISAAQSSAMYYNKKVKVYDPCITGPVTVLFAGLSAGSLSAACRIDRYFLNYHPNNYSQYTLYNSRYHFSFVGCTFVTLIAAHRYCKGVYALRNYDVKND